VAAGLDEPARDRGAAESAAVTVGGEDRLVEEADAFSVQGIGAVRPLLKKPAQTRQEQSEEGLIWSGL
jgi:hypothetical protein